MLACSVFVALACSCSGEPSESKGGRKRQATAPPALPSVATARKHPPVRQIAPPASGLPQRPSPGYNPITPAKVALGELLFFDPRLSVSGRVSCASCHRPGHGFASTAALDKTAAGATNARHTPSLWNTAHAGSWPWDGAETTLEGQILAHARGQLGRDLGQALADLGRYPEYAERFAEVGAVPSGRAATEVLASFIRTLESGDAPWDRYEQGDPNAVSKAAIAGYEVFRNRAQCAICHPPPLYTDHRFHALHVTVDRGDPGRARVTRRPEDRSAYRTPSLRGLLHTAPYFHDGSARTLEDALARKLAAGTVTGDAAVDRRLARSPLNGQEREQLMEFLRALSREKPAVYPVPRLPEAPVFEPDGGALDGVPPPP